MQAVSGLVELRDSSALLESPLSEITKERGHKEDKSCPNENHPALVLTEAGRSKDLS